MIACEDFWQALEAERKNKKNKKRAEEGVCEYNGEMNISGGFSLCILLEFLCVDLHNQFNNVINQCYLFLHCGP